MSVLITLSVVCLNFLCIYFSFLSKIWILLLLLLLLSLLLLLILILMLLSLLILLLLGEFFRLYLFLRIVVLDLWIIREILVRKFSSLVLVLHIIIKVIINIFFTFSVHVSFFLIICPKALRIFIVPGRIRQVWFLPLVSGCQIIFSWIELMTVTPFLKIVVYSLGFWLILVILSCWFIVRVILAVLIVTIPVIFRARTF